MSVNCQTNWLKHLDYIEQVAISNPGLSYIKSRRIDWKFRSLCKAEERNSQGDINNPAPCLGPHIPSLFLFKCSHCTKSSVLINTPLAIAYLVVQTSLNWELSFSIRKFTGHYISLTLATICRQLFFVRAYY